MNAAFKASLIAVAILTAACSDGDPNPLGSTQSSDSTVDPTAILTVTPAADTVTVGDTMRFMAATPDSQPVSWAVSDITVARIEGQLRFSVLLRAVRTGAATVTATSAGRSGSAQLVVMEPVPVASVTVTPRADTVAAGDSADFVANLRDAQGDPLSGRTVTWTVSDSSVARIERTLGQSAQLRALNGGATTVTATIEGKSGTAELAVTAPAPVASVTVWPADTTLAVGQDSVFFYATLRDADGTPLSGRAVTWSVSDSAGRDSAVARIQYASGQTAVIHAVQVGSAVLTATSEGKSGTAQIVVTAPVPVASVIVTPPADTLVVGDTASFGAVLRDAQGNRVSGRVVTWTVTDPSVARIDFAAGETAVITALQAGSAVLTATSEGKSGSAEVVVTAPAPVATVTIVPESATLAVGDSVWFRAELRDSGGNLLANRTASWSVSDSTVIELHGYGAWALVQPRSSGSAILRASSQGKRGEASIVVR